MDLGRVVRHAPAAVTGAGREAAVLVPVVERRDGACLLFTKRAAHLGEHPRQMSFPGGGREPGDRDLEATALREAAEEIGLDPAEATVLGRLDDIHTVTDYAVRPFVAVVPDREYVPNESEVSEVVCLRVADLADHRNVATERRPHPSAGEITVHYVTVDGYTVWGATARVLVQFLRVVAGWHPPVDPPPGSPPADQVVDRVAEESGDVDAPPRDDAEPPGGDARDAEPPADGDPRSADRDA